MGKNSPLQPNAEIPSAISVTGDSSALMFFSFVIHTSTKQYEIRIPSASVPDDWLHGVFMFRGPDNGTSLYINGNLVGSESVGWDDRTFPESSGEVVMGRVTTQVDMQYAHVTVDELYFWTESLTTDQVGEVYNWY